MLYISQYLSERQPCRGIGPRINKDKETIISVRGGGAGGAAAPPVGEKIVLFGQN